MSKKPWLLISFLAMCGILPVLLIVGAVAYNQYKTSTLEKAHAALLAAHPLTEQAIIADINTERTKRNIAPLSVNNDLMQSSKLKCEDMVANGYYDHKRPSDGKKGSDWIAESTKNWKVANENLNIGVFDNSQAVIDSWIGSAAHMNTLLDAKFTDTGVAICNKGVEKAVVQHFAAYFSQAEINARTPAQPQVRYVQTPSMPQTCYTRYNSGYIGAGLSPSATTTCY